jgi:UDP-GlcNAc:undecaprenyl-phosphate GlcNAc-1-phosphate transferase
VLDYPGGRKVHAEATPLLGGVGIYIGLLVAICFNLDHFSNVLPFFLGATAIFIIGLLEDIRGVSAQMRFLLQVAVSLILVRMGMSVSFLPNGWWKNLGEALVTVVWIVGVTNAYNFLDGLDGLAAGSAAINFFFFFTILYSTAQYSVGLICASLIGACLAFLPFNFSKTKIFLGEAGSTLLGFSLAAMGLMGSWASDNVVKLFIPVIILGVPIFDMIFTTIMRVKEGKVDSLVSWLRYGGKDHFHHYLVELGLRPVRAVFFIYSITFFLGISAILLSNGTYTDAILSLLQAGIIFGGIAQLIVVGQRRRSGWK